MATKSVISDKQIVRLVSLGKTAKDIGEVSSLSPRTIEKRLEILKGAYKTKSTAHLVAHFLRLGIIK